MHMNTEKRKETVEKVEKDKGIVASRFQNEKSAILSQSSNLQERKFRLVTKEKREILQFLITNQT